VARIEKLFKKIDKAKELRQKAEEEVGIVLPSAVQEVFSKDEKKCEVKKLGEVCRINPSKAELRNVSDNLEVSFIPMSAVDNVSGSITTQEKKLLGKVKKGYTYFKEGDVLFAKITPCMENGKVAIAKDLSNGVGFGSTEFHVLRPSKAILSEWIYFYIRQPWFCKEAKKHFTGTAGQQRVPKEFLERAKIPLSPLSEQKKIVAYFDSLREKVEKLKQFQQNQLEELTELKQSILNKAFTK
jgi:type I restriction enzyme S subunit